MGLVVGSRGRLHIAGSILASAPGHLFDLAFEVLAGDEIRNVVIIGLLAVLGQALVALGQLTERS